MAGASLSQDPEQIDRHCCAWGQTTMSEVWTEGRTEGSSCLVLPSLATPSAGSPAEESINNSAVTSTAVRMSSQTRYGRKSLSRSVSLALP